MVRDAFNLNGKVAVLTGASKGIGKSIARGLAEFGASVIISSRKQAAVDEVAEELRKEGLEATSIECHVGDPDQLLGLIKKTMDIYGGIDILVNNAAINPVFGPLEEVDNTLFDKVVNVNLKACLLLSNLCHPIMKSRGGGSIINISSVEGLKPSFGLGLYSLSKAGLVMLTKNQAKEWGKDKIRSNVICPGLVKTKLSAGIWQNESFFNQVLQHIPMNRMAQPNEIAGLAVFLASDAASYCTGSVITADGGISLA